MEGEGLIGKRGTVLLIILSLYGRETSAVT